MLSIDQVDVTIQSVRALRGFSLNVAPGSMVGLVGRNGAGKTTLLRTIMGQLKPTSGRVAWDGVDLAGVPRHGRAAHRYAGGAIWRAVVHDEHQFHPRRPALIRRRRHQPAGALRAR